MHDYDIDYYRGRIDQELIAASGASDDTARTIHLGLAHAYAELISNAESGADLVQILPAMDEAGPSSMTTVRIAQHPADWAYY